LISHISCGVSSCKTKRWIARVSRKPGLPLVN
jgi:hypothetical protein